MPERSLYGQIIKNESKKINKTIGICCAFDPYLNLNCSHYSDEDIANIELLKKILTDNKYCDDVIRGHNENHNTCRYEKEHDPYYTTTNIYRFHHQNFLNNYFGRSNINLTYINKKLENKKAQIDQILEKYSKKCKKCRK